MTIPDDPGALRTYYDPSLWDALGPLVVKELATKKQHIVDGRWKTLEEVRQMIGFTQGLTWVLDTANDLTRIEDSPTAL
jgi:hypothetical protein